MTEDCHILTLPDEILLRIFQNKCLIIEDIFNITITCKRFNIVCEIQILWHNKFIDRWPWIWEQIKRRDHGIEDWKQCSLLIENFQHKLRNYLPTLSEKLYIFEHINSPVLSSIIHLYPVAKYSNIYSYDELQRIISSVKHPLNPDEEESRHLEENFYHDVRLGQRPGWKRVLPTPTSSVLLPRIDNLTGWYYARKLKQFVHIDICQNEWNEYLNRPLNEQCLERGATLLEKWINFNLNLTFHQVSDKLDGLASESLDHLKNSYPKHPAAMSPLRHVEDPLEETLWTASDAKLVFNSINYILYEKHKFEGNAHNYYAKENSFISQILETKKGIPITMCIIYAAVAHRLGILLEPLNFPRHFVLRWKVPGLNEFEFVDAFQNGKRRNKLDLVRSILPATLDVESVTTDEICTHMGVYQRMTNNIFRLFREMGKVEDVWLVLELQAILSTAADKTNILFNGLFQVYNRLQINYDKIIEACEYYLENSESGGRYGVLGIKDEFIKLLARLHDPPPPIIPQNRDVHTVNFAIGMVMKHKLYHYICVIYGWDHVCKMPEDWIVRMNVYALKNSKNQPFYNVLGADGSNRYAAEENLLYVEPTLVSHPDIGRYFEAFDGRYYVPNEQLRQRYPDEEIVRDNCILQNSLVSS